MAKWNCTNCGHTTEDNKVIWGDCPFCRGKNSFLIIPERMDNTLFIAIVTVVRNCYRLNTILNQRQDAVELWDYNTKVYTVRDWLQFKAFFGNYFYRQFAPKESE